MNDGFMKKFTSFYVILIFLLSSSTSNASLILFDEFPIGTVVDDEYGNVGVVFSTSGAASALIVDIGPDATIGNPDIPTASPTGLRIDPASFGDILHVTFVDPVDEITPAFVTSASFSFVSDAAGADYGRLRAFNEFNSLVEERISILGGPVGGAQEYETLTVNGPKIMRLEIDGFLGDVIIDTLEFTPLASPSVVPEPSTIAIWSVLGLVGAGVRRRRNRAA